MTNKTKIIIASASLIVLTGTLMYVSYLKKNLKLLVDALYNYKLGKYENIKISFTNIKFTMNLIFDNKGDISAKVYNQDYKVYANGVYVSKAFNDEVLLIKSNGITKFPINVDISTKDLLKAGLKNTSEILSDPNNIEIVIKGSFDFKSGIFGMSKFPFETKFKVGDMT